MKQTQQKPQIIHYDKEQYQRHLNEIAMVESEIKQLAAELATADNRITDGMFISSEARYLSNQLARLKAELRELKNKQIEIIDTSKDTNIVSLGHTYHIRLQFSNGQQPEYTFKLVEKRTVNDMSKLSIETPVGAGIYNKEVGGTYSLTIGQNPATVTILEEIKTQSTENENDSTQM